MRAQRTHRDSIALDVVMVIGLAALAPATWAQERGACVAAHVPEAFTLPDGSLHPAGRLTLCTVQAFTPVVGLHRVWAEGESATLVMSRRARPEEIVERPEILFRRTPGEALELIGYVLTTGHTSWSYALRRSNRNAPVEPSLAGTPQATGDLVTVVAANTN